MARRRTALLLFLGTLALLALTPAHHETAVAGRVTDGADPVAGARVRWQGRRDYTTTDAAGRFRLPPRPSPHARAAASKPGYRIASANDPYDLRLAPLPRDDREDYAWLDAGDCARCHQAIHREWAGSAHANAARNPKFLSLFAGTDGTSPPRDDWSVAKQHPLGMGVCAACHVPTLAASSLDNDVREAKGAAAGGVHCDFCHKVADAPTDKLGTRFGRDGLALLRPAAGDRLFFGPLDDAVHVGESFAYAPVYRQSRYCASCHEGVVFGVHAYATYSEWLASPAGKQGVQCQQCHMAPTGTRTNVAPGRGGIDRDPATLASHAFPGGTPDMLRRCLTLSAGSSAIAAGVRVDVTVRAEQVGHRVPTGFTDRHLVLVVEAFDHDGNALAPADGPTLPASAGAWSGRAGWLYAKQLFDERGRSPVPFWSAVSQIRDTRLSPGEADRRAFTFPAGAARVEVRLWYRRFWPAVAGPRGWADNDTLVASQTVR